ncbi:alpha/beta fold hydrolase [Mucilaginibacter pineti]|nr:alpha/beta hydrolase [Mucilaginibacter pineti]
MLLLIPGYGVSQQATPLWQTLPVEPTMPAANQSGLAPVNDIKMYYAIFNKYGKDPVILLHGGFVSSDVWGFEVPLLMKTHQVIIVDSRGHGRSTMTDQPFSYSLMSSDVLLLMDFLQIKNASIVGWSDGGIIGYLLAIYHPERVNKLFTFGANYNSSGYNSAPSDTSTAARFMERAATNYRRLSSTPDNFSGLKKALSKLYGTEPNLTAAELGMIKAPAVITFGEYEQFIKRDHFKKMVKLIPNARLVMLPNIGHGGPLQDPIRFHGAVMKLLDENRL